MARPDVTVIIPAHNPNPDDLQRAVDAAWTNRCVRRVIVVDDGSDKPLARMPRHTQSLSGPESGAPVVIPVHTNAIEAAHIELIDHCEIVTIDNQGVPQARNAGLSLVRSGWVLVCDQDDCYADGSIDALRQAVTDTMQYAYGDTDYVLQGQVHRPGAWHNRLNVGQFGTRYGILWHVGRKVRFEPMWFNDWDLVLQLEAQGCTGVYVPQVTLQRYKRPDGMMSRLTPQQRQDAYDALKQRWGW